LKLHSNTLTAAAVRTAAQTARCAYGQDIYVDEVKDVGSRSRKQGVSFYASSLHGRYASAHDQSQRAANWDAYGYLIAELFKVDPDAKIGIYDGATDFMVRTSDEANRNALYGKRPDHTASFLEVL
jgi:hypothetical protein